MKHKAKIISVLTTLFMISLGVVVNIKPAAKVSATIEPNRNMVSSDYVRILVVPDPNDSWNASSAVTGIVVLQDSSATVIEKDAKVKYGDSGSRHLIEHDLQYRADKDTLSGKKFWYFNVRYDLISGKDFQVVRFNPTLTAEGQHLAWNATKKYAFTDDLIAKVWKLDAPSDLNSNINFSRSTGAGLSNLMVSYVLEGYMTCSPSPLNGYMAYGELNQTYNLDNRTASTTTFRDFDYNDYDENSTYDVGRQNNVGDKITSVGAKVLAMKALYEAATLGSGVVHNETNNNVTLTIILGVSLAVLSGWFLLSKKRKTIKN